MLKISVTTDAAKVIRQLQANQKQVAFATAKAITKTAQQTREAEYAEMKRVFDRPTGYTLNSLYVKPATKATLEGRVWLKDDVFKGTPAAKYLLPQITGGMRKHKRFERALIQSGIMPAQYYAVPGSAAPLDAYGNLTAPFIVKLLSYLRAFGESGYKANMTDIGRARTNKAMSKRIGGDAAYFVLHDAQRKPVGIFQRIRFAAGSAIKPIVIFVKQPQYSLRFNFEQVAQRTIDQVFVPNLEVALNEALNTARN